jgi:hypothetical protein
VLRTARAGDLLRSSSENAPRTSAREEIDRVELERGKPLRLVFDFTATATASRGDNSQRRADSEIIPEADNHAGNGTAELCAMEQRDERHGDDQPDHRGHSLDIKISGTVYPLLESSIVRFANRRKNR